MGLDEEEIEDVVENLEEAEITEIQVGMTVEEVEAI